MQMHNLKCEVKYELTTQKYPTKYTTRTAPIMMRIVLVDKADLLLSFAVMIFAEMICKDFVFGNMCECKYIAKC